MTVTAGAGVTATMTASCSGIQPMGFLWQGFPPAPGFANNGQTSVTVGPLTTPGTYQFNFTATNAIGSSFPVAMLTVLPVGGTPTPTPSSCTATPAAVVADFAASGQTWVELNIQQAGAVSVALPKNGQGVITELRSIQSTISQSDLTDEIAISTCPGDFNVPAECKTWGTVWGSATYLRGYTTATPVAGICSMTLGTAYYANVRNTKFDRVTPSCSAISCNMKLQYNPA
jgi:PKD repeat protein